MRKDEFAKNLGFADWEQLMRDDVTTEIRRHGDVSFYVTNCDLLNPDSTLGFAAWDDFELSPHRVSFYPFFYEAEDASILGYALNLDDPAGQFMAVLEGLDEQLERPHREGHCEHAGHCEIVPVLLSFLRSPEGKKSLEGFADWFFEETPAQIFSKLCAGPFDSTKWIAEEELPAWFQAVRDAGIEYAIYDMPEEKKELK
jgi:hypothetical protein